MNIGTRSSCNASLSGLAPIDGTTLSLTRMPARRRPAYLRTPRRSINTALQKPASIRLLSPWHAKRLQKLPGGVHPPPQPSPHSLMNGPRTFLSEPPPCNAFAYQSLHHLNTKDVANCQVKTARPGRRARHTEVPSRLATVANKFHPPIHSQTPGDLVLAQIELSGTALPGRWP